MKVSILDSCFPINKQGFGVSASYLRWELKRNKIYYEKDPSFADAIFVTMQDPRQIKFLENVRKRFKEKIIVCGGPASTAPYLLGEHCDLVCVGDGAAFINDFSRNGFESSRSLGNCYFKGKKEKTSIDYGFPFEAPPIVGDNGHLNIWISRGCKKKCYFCQTGWAYKYVENENILSVLRKIKINQKNKITYVSNDLGQYRYFSSLPKNGDGSYSVQFLLKNRILPRARVVRLGVEGVSERIRKIINKEIKNEDLYNLTLAMNRAGKSVKFFMMSGFFFEGKDDWEELKDFIKMYRNKDCKGTLEISFSAFIPSPATPFSNIPLTDDYYDMFLDFKEWFFNMGWSNKIKLLNLSKPETRLLSAEMHLGVDSSYLRKWRIKNPNDEIISYPYSLQVKKTRERIFKKLGNC